MVRQTEAFSQRPGIHQALHEAPEWKKAERLPTPAPTRWQVSWRGGPILTGVSPHAQAGSRSCPPHCQGPRVRPPVHLPWVESDLPGAHAGAGQGGRAPTAGNIWFELSVGSTDQAAKEFVS